MEDNIANEPIIEAMYNIEDEFTQFAVQKCTYKCFNDTKQNRKVHGKREVLKANELEFVPNDEKIIIHNELDRSYLVFDSKNDLLKHFKSIVGPKSLHEVIIGSHQQKIKFNIDLKLPFAGFNEIPKLDGPQMPVVLTKPNESELTGDDDIDGIIWDTYNNEIKEYNARMTKYNDMMEKCNNIPVKTKKLMWLNRTMIEKIKSIFKDCYSQECPIAVCDSSKDGVKYLQYYIITDFSVTNN